MSAEYAVAIVDALRAIATLLGFIAGTLVIGCAGIWAAALRRR